jgi:hypothetical protein
MACGNLHIRTELTDPTLLPNNITQTIVENGLRIGLIPESTVESLYYNIIVRNNISQIIAKTDFITYIGTGNYIYITIPFDTIPQIAQVINIQLTSDSDCNFSTNYTILPYTLPNFSVDSTSVVTNGVLEKYIKIKPTISTGGFDVDKTYYYNCSSPYISDTECFLEFKSNKNLSKILDILPNTDTQICPQPLEWSFSDIICISPETNVTATACTIVCNNIINISGSIYRVSFSQENITEFTWTLYNLNNTEISHGNIETENISEYFEVDFGNLIEGTYKLILSPIYCSSTIPVNVKYFTVNVTRTVSARIVNQVPDLDIVPETYWNHFNPDKIPDIDITHTFDNLLNKYIPTKWLFFNSYQGLSKFGANSVEQLSKLFKKGFTQIGLDSLPQYETNLENYVNGDKIVGYTKTDVNDITYTDFKNFVNGSFGFCETYKISKTDNKYNLFANFIQYSGKYSSTTTQESTNFLVTGHYSAIEITNGRFGFDNLSYANSDGYITSDTYSKGNNYSFINYSDNSVETNYKNKSLKESDKLLLSSIQTYYFETLLPQNFQVKDQNNLDWFTINHFGNEATNLVGVGQTPNSEHWASQIAGNVQNLYNRAKVFGQDIVITIKPTCDRGETYLHSKTLSIFNNGKYIKEWSRYSNLLLDNTTGQTYDSNFETEIITNLVAEGQVILSYFAGAKGINFNSNLLTNELVPRIKNVNLKKGFRYDDLTSGNQNYDAYLYTMKAMWRLSQKIPISSNKNYSFFDICDGDEIYLNYETEVSYDGGINFIKQRALDWQINQKSPVLAVVNLKKNIIAICALQAYNVEQDSATIRYNKNGINFQETILIPINKISIYMFDLGQIQ